MLTQIGRLLFAIGVVVAIALAAKAPKWEAAQEAARQLAGHMPEDALVQVEVPANDVLDAKKSDALEADLRRALAMEGVKVNVPTRKEDPNGGAPTETYEKAATHWVPVTPLDKERALLKATTSSGDVTPPISLELERGWPKTVPLWGAFAALAALGVVLWRMGASAAAKAAAADSGDAEGNPFALLSGLVAPAKALGEEIDGLDEKQVTARVDALLEGYLLPLALVRQRIIDRLGMKQGSEILITLAFGERMLNRVWSAAADGHLPEARACFPEALGALEEAERLARLAVEGGAGGPSGAPVAVGD